MKSAYRSVTLPLRDLKRLAQGEASVHAANCANRALRDEAKPQQYQHPDNLRTALRHIGALLKEYDNLGGLLTEEEQIALRAAANTLRWVLQREGFHGPLRRLRFAATEAAAKRRKGRKSNLADKIAKFLRARKREAVLARKMLASDLPPVDELDAARRAKADKGPR